MLSSSEGAVGAPCVRGGRLGRAALLVSSLVLVLANACASARAKLPPITLVPTGTHHVGKFIWYDLLTDGVPAVKQFYGSLFGWEFDGPYGEEERFTLITHRGTPIGGIVDHEPQNPKVSETQWVASLSVADVDGAVDLVRQNGGAVYFEPEDIPDRGRIAVVSDPQGALLAFVRTERGDPADEEEPVPNRWVWTELWADDVQEAVSFYQSLVGYELETAELFAGRTYNVLMREDKARAGVIAVPFDGVRPNWLPYVLVDDPAAVAARVESLGGKVLVAPSQDVRAGSVALVADPSGGAFAVQKWPIESEERRSER